MPLKGIYFGVQQFSIVEIVSRHPILGYSNGMLAF